MAGTLTIPQTTLSPGTRNFGPAPVDDADTMAVLTIDRTVPGGLNSLTPAVTIGIAIDQSGDGGATWANLAGAVLAGGSAAEDPRHPGISSVRVQFSPGAGRQARATVTVAGGSVTVAGTLTTS
jgi:hypothetical protein